MITFLNVSRIIVVKVTNKKTMILKDITPPVNVLVYASLLKRKNWVEENKSHFFSPYRATEMIVMKELYK